MELRGRHRTGTEITTKLTLGGHEFSDFWSDM